MKKSKRKFKFKKLYLRKEILEAIMKEAQEFSNYYMSILKWD